MPLRSSGKLPGSPNQWLRLALIIALLGTGLYSAWQRQQDQGRAHAPAPSRARQESESSEVESDDRLKAAQDNANRTQSDIAQRGPSIARTRVAKQTIRNEDGKIVFQGDVDVGPTLVRINRGEQLEFTHDGIVFQNRERRLPPKPAGYYHEYVHPTPGLDGPGPQRIVRGRNGEIFYTPDHYRTFQRLDE
jgi:guanyl-specific ribonuclease Sa